MNCTEFIAQLDELFERHNIHQALRDDLRAHLAQCEHCVVTYNTTRQTIEIYRNNELYDLPEELHARLHSSIMARCREHFEAAKLRK